MLKDNKNAENLIENLKLKDKIYYPKIESQADSSSSSEIHGTSASPSEADSNKYL